MQKMQNRKLQKIPSQPLFSVKQKRLLFIVFSIAAFARLYFIGKSRPELEIESELYRNFQLVAKGVIPFDGQPMTGRFCLFFLYFILTNNKEERIPIMQRYFRAFSGLIGCFSPVLVTASLFLYGYDEFVSTFIGVLISLDPNMIVWSRIYSSHSLFILFCTLVIFLNSLEKHTTHPLLQQAQSLCAAFAIFTDYLGISIVLFLILKSTNRRKLSKDLISLLPVYFIGELGLKMLFSESEKLKDPNEPFSLRIKMIARELRLNLFNNNLHIYDLFLWPLGILKPKRIFVDENIKIVSMASPVLSWIMLISSIVDYKNTFSKFYIFNLLLIWLMRAVDASNYHIATIIGIISFAGCLQKTTKLTKRFVCLTATLLSLLLFIIYFPWIYGIQTSEMYDTLINVWSI